MPQGHRCSRLNWSRTAIWFRTSFRKVQRSRSLCTAPDDCSRTASSTPMHADPALRFRRSPQFGSCISDGNSALKRFRLEPFRPVAITCGRVRGGLINLNHPLAEKPGRFRHLLIHGKKAPSTTASYSSEGCRTRRRSAAQEVERVTPAVTSARPEARKLHPHCQWRARMCHYA